MAQAAAALLHNVSLGVPPGAEPSTCDSTGISLDLAEEIWLQLLSGLPVALRAQRDAEAQRRLLIALGQLFLRGGKQTAELASAICIGKSLLGELPATVGGTVGGAVGGGLIEQVRALMSDDEMVE